MLTNVTLSTWRVVPFAILAYLENGRRNSSKIAGRTAKDDSKDSAFDGSLYTGELRRGCS